MLKKTIILWAGIIPLSVINGIFRENVLVPMMGTSYALPLSGLSLCLLILMLGYLGVIWIGKQNPGIYWKIGGLWCLLTLCFECLFGYFILKRPLNQLLQAYDVRTGNLWLLVIITVFCTPWFAAKARKFF